ncbi:hypothetical protein [Streptomyces vinaceus]|uniref:hypothetical protein n=1 Tax=Streptomyces vinaceus TaxID=1960 RepID=UPI0035DE58AE
MEEFLVNAPWGLLKIESVGSQGDIPDEDPNGRPVSANEGCVAVAVLHGDFGSVRVRVGRGEREGCGILAFEGVIACPSRMIEISDIVGDNSYIQLPVEADSVALTVELDKLEMAEIVTVKIK